MDKIRDVLTDRLFWAAVLATGVLSLLVDFLTGFTTIWWRFTAGDVVILAGILLIFRLYPASADDPPSGNGDG